MPSVKMQLRTKKNTQE